MKRFLLAVLLAAMGVPAFAAVPANATIKWTLPTTTVNGFPLTGVNALTKVQLFISSTAIPDTFTGAPSFEVPDVGQPVPTSYIYWGFAGSPVFVRLKMCNASVCSDFSVQGSGTLPIPADKPNVATAVTISVALQ